MIRDHGDAVEADLAFAGFDLRDLWRRGSGMSWRRLYVLLTGMPDDARFREALREEREKALVPTVDLIRQRQAEFERRNAARLAEEVAADV